MGDFKFEFCHVLGAIATASYEDKPAAVVGNHGS
jgi:hypothetical protein